MRREDYDNSFFTINRLEEKLKEAYEEIGRLKLELQQERNKNNAWAMTTNVWEMTTLGGDIKKC